VRKAFYLSATALLGVLGYLALGQYTLPEGPGKDLVLAKCQSCHEIGFVARERLSRDRWDGVIEEMELRGLKLTQEERAAILDYLATYLGLTPPPGGTPGPHRPGPQDRRPGLRHLLGVPRPSRGREPAQLSPA